MTNPMLFLLAFIAFADAPKANLMEIYVDSAKTYSAKEVYSLQELRSLYARVARKTSQRKDLSDRNEANVLVCVDAENHIRFRPFLTDQWIRIDNARTLATKLDENVFTDCSFMPVFLIVDPKSDPDAVGKVVQLVLEEKKYAQLTLMFGGRVVVETEVSRKCP